MAISLAQLAGAALCLVGAAGEHALDVGPHHTYTDDRHAFARAVALGCRQYPTESGPAPRVSSLCTFSVAGAAAKGHFLSPYKMSIIRTSKQAARYTVLDNTALEDVRLSWRAKGLHCYLMSKPDGWKVQVAQLVAGSKEGRDAVYTALGELLEHGYAQRQQQRGGDGRIAAWDYTIYEVPQGSAPLTGKPYTVNPSLVSTEVSNNITTLDAPKRSRPAPAGATFEQAWQAYPKRSGGNSRVAAEKAWKARLAQGHKPDAMYDGTLRYALYCELSSRVGTEYVMMASTFYGPTLRFTEEWEVDMGNTNTKAPQEVVGDDESSYIGTVVA